jgi:hypothetical protein
MRNTAYAVACIVLPALWGLAASVIYDRIAARRKRQSPEQADTADMYHI